MAILNDTLQYETLVYSHVIHRDHIKGYSREYVYEQTISAKK